MVLSYDQEVNLVKGIYLASGFSEYESETVARVVTHSDFTGVYSHGLSRLTRYLKQIKQGVLNPKPDFKKVVDNETVLVYDADNGSGIVNVNRAYDEALERARKYGMAFATGRHSSNIGCGSYYGWRAAKDNMVLLAGCNTYAFGAPFGGADKLLGTNPIIFAAPSNEEYPIVLDISTTIVASGKIQAAEREGKSINPEWAKDFEGNPTSNPAEAYSLNPIAAHKGYGLQVMVDILSTVFSKAAYGSDIGLYSKLEMENTGFYLLLIDPTRFMPLDEFKANIDRYIRMMKDSRKAPGVDEIFLPGEIEFRKFEANKKTGMSFSPALEKELSELAVSLGIVPEGTSFEELVNRFNSEVNHDE